MTYTSRAGGGRQDCTRAKDAAQVSKPKRDAPFQSGRGRYSVEPFFKSDYDRKVECALSGGHLAG
jgi:hypothetical protein